MVEVLNVFFKLTGLSACSQAALANKRLKDALMNRSEAAEKRKNVPGKGSAAATSRDKVCQSSQHCMFSVSTPCPVSSFGHVNGQ